MAPVLSPDEHTLFVCNRFENTASLIALDPPRELRRIPVPWEPIAAAITPDGRFLLVANHLPSGRADAHYVATSVSIIATSTTKVVKDIALPNGSVGAHGISVSPDGRFACVTHTLAKFKVPTTHLEFGWMNSSALSILDLATLKVADTVPLDEAAKGAADPWAVAWAAEGDCICVTHAGTHELSLIDSQQLSLKSSSTRSDEPTDGLAFLGAIRRRIALEGNGPRALAVVGTRAFVAEYFTDSLSVVDIRTGTIRSRIALGSKLAGNLRRQGERLFHDASICRQQWQSCASCHPEGRADGLNWDLLNDGIGNPKNTKSLLLAHRTPPAMTLGLRDTAEAAVRSGIKHILFAVRPESEALAIDEYLKSLEPIPSPHLVGGELSAAARRGALLFHDARVGCAECHPPALYTDLKAHDVGTQTRGDKPSDKFDTPTLVECWRTAPYLHDGSAATVREAVTQRNHEDRHGHTAHLTEPQIDDLVAFVLSL